MTHGLQSSHEVSGAAHLPAPLTDTSRVEYVTNAGTSVTALRVEGPGPSVEHRTAALRRELADLAESEELHSANSADFWAELRDVKPLVAYPGRVIWKISVPPASGARVAARLADGQDVLRYFDWGGGLIWLALPASDALAFEARHAAVRDALKECGGHATLVRAPEDVRARVPVFQPQDEVQAALTKRVKAGFDPKGILNPGRMFAGV